MKKVLIPTKLESIAKELLVQHGGYQVVQDAKTPLEEQIATHKDTYALIVRSEKVTAAVMDALPQLRVVIRAGAGYNTIDTRHARKKGIDVMNTPGANANAVAEEVVALMLADARHIVLADASTRAGGWEKNRFMGREITGKTIGIVGLGAIGRTLVKRLQGFEMKVLGFDPVISEERARDLGVSLVDMPRLFAESDYVSLHIPANDQTKGMINTSLLSLMKPGAVIINCARCEVVNEDDLRAAKASNGIHYLNDVYPKDEAGPKTVADIADIMLPHLGASTVEANTNAARRAAEQLVEYDDKGITSFVVNRDIPEGLDEAFGELANVLARLCRQVVGEAHPLARIETSFYGSLQPYARWLLLPVVAGINKDFDRSMDHAAALKFLKDMGIDYADRETDPKKGYENSITIDFTANLGGGKLAEASVRGTVTEGNLMISRISDFDKLYFEPKGHTVMFIYNDRPGVLGCIAAAMAAAGINIDDVRNPHNSAGDQSLAILKVNQVVSSDLVKKVAADISATTAFYINL